MKIPWYRRLGGQLLLASLIFLTITIVAVAGITIVGFDRTQSEAVRQSGAELERQASEQLRLYAEQEALVLSGLLTSHSSLTRQAVALLNAPLSDELLDALPEAELRQTSAGLRYDARDDRVTDLAIYTYIPLGPQLTQDIRRSAPLEVVFPGMLTEAAYGEAMYFISDQGTTRFFPLGLLVLTENNQDIPADFPVMEQPFFTIAAPEANPQGETRWTEPYIDPAGQGLLVTAATPIYRGDTFEGIIGIDVSLDGIISSLVELKPSLNAGILLLDASSTLIAATPGTLPLLGLPETGGVTETLGIQLAPPDSAEAEAFRHAMNDDQSGAAHLSWGGRELLMVHAHLGAPDWTLVFVLPAQDVTANAQQIGAAIDRGAGETLTVVLGALGLLALFGLIAMFLVSRSLSRPLQELLSGTTAIAQRRYDVSLPVSGSGEFSALAASFNQMTATVRDSQAQLQQLNQDLERTVQERTASLEQERATLQQTLDELRQMSNVVAQLNTPIMPVLPGVLVIPLIGVLSPERVQALRAEMAGMASAANARTVILDLTGVTALDGDASESFLRGLQSLRLLGAEALLVGINPDVAQHLVQTGDLLRSVPTLPNLAAAVEYVLRRR